MEQQIKKLKGLNKILPERRRIKKIRDPLENQDTTTKKYVDERGEYTAQADSVSTGFITLKDRSGTSRKVMTKD